MDITKALLNMALGGSAWVLWLLIGLSIASVAIMIDKALTFYRFRFNPDRFVADIEPSLRQGDWPQVISRCKQESGLEARVLLVGLREISRGRAAVQDIMEGERLRVALYLGKRLSFLGTLGANAPFIGLFGTVLGIIHAFKDLALTEGGGGPAVMAGIAEALVATAIGLLVAIPAVVMYNFFHRRLHVVQERSRFLEQLLLAHLDGAAGTAEIAVPEAQMFQPSRKAGGLI
ncbi:MAG: MotA/TolQ/ExbB proton channel family protein [Proteobacteria bacterium]|nr:MotA/TolQ/ExbB proton channel family protein [Pseudomonadota bacterium]MBU4447977.1 MotA/TolQ/ExbB proton channel family protein [Pseudomonadota bacterium]MCG2773305.1 MotA/TolQ/ExbB proton channel family protein [Desulfobacterales bacterium]